MSDIVSVESKPDEITAFMAKFQKSLDEGTFNKLILGKYRGDEPQLKRIIVQKINLKGLESLSFVHRYKTRDVTKNASLEDGIMVISEFIGDSFKSANLFTQSETVQIEFSKKGKCFMNCTKVASGEISDNKHNREKNRLIDSDKQFLVELGVTDTKHQLIPSMSRKWKQINKFLEILQAAYNTSLLSEKSDINVVDFGSGKGYLTFAVHDYLQNEIGVNTHTTGIELRENLVSFCNKVVGAVGLHGLCFDQGDVRDYHAKDIDILIALHACDTATDIAIDMGIRAGAEIIMCSPCCHKQIRPQMSLPEVIQPVLQFGIHLGQEAEMVTDSIRALLLEANGYKSQIFEFVSLEHTSKNKMILAVKHNRPVEKNTILNKVEQLKSFYGIKEHCLESLLKLEPGS